jgi:hypothetical protein
VTHRPPELEVEPEELAPEELAALLVELLPARLVVLVRVDAPLLEAVVLLDLLVAPLLLPVAEPVELPELALPELPFDITPEGPQPAERAKRSTLPRAEARTNG